MPEWSCGQFGIFQRRRRTATLSVRDALLSDLGLQVKRMIGKAGDAGRPSKRCGTFQRLRCTAALRESLSGLPQQHCLQSF